MQDLSIKTKPVLYLPGITTKGVDLYYEEMG
jgi:hypothetical protein